MTNAPIILVPGWWLGGWAWEEVADLLRADGHDVTALTLPGLESPDADRSAITASDHVEAICAALRAAPAPAVLAVHSGAGYTGYAASDSCPERIAAMVYVDTAPGIGAPDPEFDGVEKLMPSLGELRAEENLDGLSDEQLETFLRRAVPEPGGVLREAVPLTNEARLDLPSTMICTAFSAEEYRAYHREHNPGWLAGMAEVRNIEFVDLPTSHWPMWSRPADLARVIGQTASAHGRDRR
jgi:pimeloyl-ACP methyl ester carboxylesterase